MLRTLFFIGSTPYRIRLAEQIIRLYLLVFMYLTKVGQDGIRTWNDE